MLQRSEKVLKGLLWWLVVFHGTLGLLGLFSKESAVFLAAKFFNFQLELTTQMYWVLNPFAAYLMAFAGFMAIAARDPKRHTSLIHVGAALLGLRVVQRVVFLLTADDALIVSASRGGIILVLSVTLVIAISLVVLTKKLNESGPVA